MYKQVKTIVGGAVLAMGLLAAPIALYAHEEGSGMMSGNSGNMMGGGSMMGQGSGRMMGMMNMMSQMSRMMDTCNNMMQSGNQPPNSQFHKDSEGPQKG